LKKIEHEVTEDVLQEAKKHPGGWVYKIEGQYASDVAVPPEAIVGAWEVDASGNLTGKFIDNPRFKPKLD
jgi:hypothetical protein